MKRLMTLAIFASLATLALPGCDDGGAAKGGDTKAGDKASDKSGDKAGDKAGGGDVTAEVDAAWVVCASCHGETGAGDGAAAAALDPKPRDFGDAAWQDKVDDAHLKKVILEGGPAVGLAPIMAPNPQLKDKPEVLDGLVKKIRGLKK
jgi:hypothetical protein